MSENKKYYYLKFKENYFDQDHIKVIESMKNGYEYSLILLKLYLKSLKWDGQLRINERIPYTADKIDLLAGVLNHDPGNLMHAINLAKDLGIIEILTTGEIFMSDIHNFIGHSSTEAERKSEYRKRLKSCNKKKLTYKDKNGTMSQKNPPELELELDKDKEIDIIKEIIDYLNLKANKKYKHDSAKTTSLIKARIKDGFNIDDFKKVIDTKCQKWLNNYEMNQYLRPETLFGNKFEGYLNESPPGNNDIKRPDNYLEVVT